MLERDRTVLVLIDVQGKLAEAMCEKEALVQNLRRLVLGAQAMKLPIVWTEQIPAKMGPTIPALAELLAGQCPLPKVAFSCCGEPVFLNALEATGRTQVLLCGIEAHVCVVQTAADLVARGFHVEVVGDAVSSRTAANRQLGLDKARAAGAGITGVETCLFELLKTAAAPEFRDILKLVK
jgi:nicotinamidase-related amidase